MSYTFKKTKDLIPFALKQQIKWLLFPILENKYRRYTPAFWETYNFLQESQWWPKERLLDFQTRQLKTLIQHAVLNVPYYKKRFAEYGIGPEDIKSPDDLVKLPYLSKEDIKKNSSELLAKGVSSDMIRLVHTSGTTGKPLQFYEEQNARELDYAYVFHQWSRIGVRPEDRIVQIRGSIIKSRQQVHPASGILRLSPKIESKEMAAWCLDRIAKFGAEYVHGYPSAIATLAHMVIQHKLSVDFKLKAALFASEAVYAWQRKLVKRAFGCRTFNFYGLSERVAIGAECEKSDKIHCLPQYGITEIDPSNNEIVGTSLLNFVFPFIRYRTTDIGELENNEGCDDCHRRYFPILNKIEGRLEDFIVTPGGVLISPAVITHPFKDLKTIKHTQIVQTDVNQVVIKAVPWQGAKDDQVSREGRQLCKDLQLIFGADIELRFEVVSDISLSTTGKFKWIKSEISKDALQKGID